MPDHDLITYPVSDQSSVANKHQVCFRVEAVVDTVSALCTLKERLFLRASLLNVQKDFCFNLAGGGNVVKDIDESIYSYSNDDRLKEYKLSIDSMIKDSSI